ncbi:class I SAM-dependent methyltransferase [Candidatus Saccharibacteria bacterium]|nr:class I SAM-dependent methyltransferase [Candidatus Saccharibacteria bacterium]
MNKSTQNSDQPQVTKQETEEIIRLANKVLLENVEGDFVEFGCYKGDTSVLLQELLEIAPQKSLWLYDSFAGLPEKTPEDSSSAGDAFRSGELFVTKREVIEKFKRKNLPLPKIKKAFFSDLDPASDLPDSISFAFLDGDLYSSIKTSLALVLPKLKEKGIIVVHDYNNPELPGVSKAVDEFLRLNPSFSLANRFSLAILTSRA